MPDAPEVAEIQLGPRTVSYPQPAGVVTVTVPPPPEAPRAAEELPSITEQFALACVTVRVWPAMVAVRLCGEGELFAGRVTVTCPLPVPEAGEGLRPVALQAQVEADAVTLICAVPPDAVAERRAGLMAYEQVDGANCVMVKT